MTAPLHSHPLTDVEEQRLLDFEAAWEQGGPPAPQAFAAPDATPKYLLELAHIDLERRLRGGLIASAMHYVEMWPALGPAGRDQLQTAERELRRRFRREDFDQTPTGVGGDDDRTSPPDALSVRASYTRLRPHARGGLGEVHVADDVVLGRRVAVKVLQPRWAEDPRAVRDFLVEAEITSRLEHPSIVPVHHVGRTPDGRPCYSMRFVEGRTLREAIRCYHDAPQADPAARTVAFRDLLARFVAVCNAVAYAHSRGVIHRDLKPENVMLGPFGETLVLDWGMAKAVGADELRDDLIRPRQHDGEETAAGEVRGTLAYLSPEQAAGHLDQVGPRTDVFGLGATLYAVLTGYAPYGGSASDVALTKARVADIVPPRRRAGGVPAALEAVCVKAMALRPEDRYETAADLARDVENWLAGERVVAWSEPWYEALRRQVRRRKTLVAALAVAAVLIPIAGAVASWRIAREQARADLNRQAADLRAKNAAEITAYLKEVFQSADPVGETLGFRADTDRTQKGIVRRMLDRGEALVREQLVDQPLVCADLLDTMGGSYRNLGEWDRAAALLNESLTLRREHRDDDHADIEASLHSLARLSHDRGDYAEAERLYEEVLARRLRLHGEDDLQVAQAQCYLGWVIFHRPLTGPVLYGEPLLRSEALLKRSLATRERRLPPTHRDIALTLAALAGVKACQNSKEAITLLYATRALEIFRKNDDTSAFGSVAVEFLLAEHAKNFRRYDEAERRYKRVLELSRRHLGDRHPLVILQLGALAGMYRNKGDAKSAEQVIREALRLARPLPLRSAPASVDAIRQLADHVRQRDEKEARELYEEALRYARERPKDNAGHISMIERHMGTLKPVPAGNGTPAR